MALMIIRAAALKPKVDNDLYIENIQLLQDGLRPIYTVDRKAAIRLNQRVAKMVAELVNSAGQDHDYWEAEEA